MRCVIMRRTFVALPSVPEPFYIPDSPLYTIRKVLKEELEGYVTTPSKSNDAKIYKSQ